MTVNDDNKMIIMIFVCDNQMKWLYITNSRGRHWLTLLRAKGRKCQHTADPLLAALFVCAWVRVCTTMTIHKKPHIHSKLLMLATSNSHHWSKVFLFNITMNTFLALSSYQIIQWIHRCVNYIAIFIPGFSIHSWKWISNSVFNHIIL